MPAWNSWDYRMRKEHITCVGFVENLDQLSAPTPASVSHLLSPAGQRFCAANAISLKYEHI
jgi:hypothetical protein